MKMGRFKNRTLTIAGPPIIAALVLGIISAPAVVASAEPKNVSQVVGKTPIKLRQPVDPGLGKLAPTAKAAREGMFGPQADWPLISIHAAVSRTGQVVTYGSPLGGVIQEGLNYDRWDPAAGFGHSAHVQTKGSDYNAFCNALVEIPDGRLLMVGGNSSMSTMLYTPQTAQVSMGPELNRQRWYATTLHTAEGQLLALGGAEAYNGNAYMNPKETTRVAILPEIGNGTNAWRTLSGAASAELFGSFQNHYWYPRAFNGPNGKVVGLSGNEIWELSTKGIGSIRKIGELPFDPMNSGSAVMYVPGKILVAGGGVVETSVQTTGTNQAAIVDFTGTKIKVKSTDPMHWGRNWFNMNVLPTGKVLVNGGTTIGTSGEANSPNDVRVAEVWNPETGKWAQAAKAARTRSYHSTALQLPSGAIFTGGGGAGFGPENNLNAELYYPAYLFEKRSDGEVHWAQRPRIIALAGSLRHEGKITLTLDSKSKIRSVSLISLPSVTHSQNTDQRRVPLAFKQVGKQLQVKLPKSTSTLPPGSYELNVTNSKGVPSPAQIVTFRVGKAGLVTLAGKAFLATGGDAHKM